MNFLLLKRIDRFVGTSLVGALACWQKIKTSTRQKEIFNGHPKSIVVTKYLGLGSIVHLTHTLHRLKEKYPAAKLTVVTSKANIDFLRQVTFVDHIVAVDLKSMVSLVRSLFMIFLHFRRAPADHLYDAEFLTNFSAIVAHVIKVRHRVGFRTALAGSWRAAVFDEAIVIDHSLHITKQFKQLLGEDAPKVSKKNGASVGAFNRTPPFGDRNIVGVNLNASGMASERRWPMGHFADYLTQFLTAYPDSQLVLTGLPSEKIYGEELLSLISPDVARSFVDATGKTSLPELMELISNMDLMISVDSGPLALAVYLGVPTISFWGPESPDRYGPQSGENAHHLTLSVNVKCSPCLTEANYKTAPCLGNNICMKQMSPEWAWSQSKSFLEELGQSKKAQKQLFAS